MKKKKCQLLYFNVLLQIVNAQYDCKKNEKERILNCFPIGKVKSYEIRFSLKTLRYRKTLITDYWIKGKGNEVDYAHIAHGYCYIIEN